MGGSFREGVSFGLRFVEVTDIHRERHLEMSQQHLKGEDRLGSLLLRGEGCSMLLFIRQEETGFRARTKAQNKYSKLAFL